MLAFHSLNGRQRVPVSLRTSAKDKKRKRPTIGWKNFKSNATIDKLASN
jgi:hypothetical protein